MIFTIPGNKRPIVKKVTASGAGSMQPREYSFGGMSSGFSVFDSIMPVDEIKRNQLYRNIYMYDSVSGAAVDLMSVLPFSEYSISGVNDKSILSVFQDTCEHLNVRTIMPQLCIEYLTIGKLIGTLVFNGTHGIFTDLIIQDPDYCETTPIPLQGYDPKVDIRIPPEFRKFLTSQDPRDKEAKQELSEDLIRSMLSGKVALDPLTTVYIARKTFPKDTGTSYLSRIVPFFMLEQILLEGTIQGAQRRQRAVTHIQLGSEEWEPTEAQIDEAIEMVLGADMDPVGAVIATKRDIDISEFKSGGDFWKVTDEWDGLTQAKMRSLGINESFLAGDACLTGDTLVATKEHGLKRIDSFYKSREKGRIMPLTITSHAFTNYNKSNVWMYSGKDCIFEIITEKGYTVRATKHHKFPVKRRGMEKIELKDLVVGDFLSISTRPVLRESTLVLDPFSGMPRKMTPQLAEYLGYFVTRQNKECFINEGSVCTIAFFRASELHENLFGCPINVIPTPLLDFFYSIGLTMEGIPKVILESDRHCQKAFLKAVLINNTILETTLCRELQIMLQSHGLIVCRKENVLEVTKEIYAYLDIDEKSEYSIETDGAVYFDKIKSITLYEKEEDVYDITMRDQSDPYFTANGLCVGNTYNCVTGDTIVDTEEGWIEIGTIANQLGINESYNVEQVTDWEVNLRSISGYEKNSKLIYQGIAPCVKVELQNNILTCTLNHPLMGYRPGYNRNQVFLWPAKELRMGDLIAVMDNGRYKYSMILSITEVGNLPVYDVSMAKGTSHIFIGNGIVQRQTMESALSVFIEQLRSFRLYMTQKIFYHKIFPTLARVHRFIKRKQSELDHNIRITGFAKNPSNIPVKDLIVPDIQWHKQLQPQYDESYLSILSTVQEQGVPIPLRVWAAAGGFSIEKVLDSLNEDLDTRSKLSDFHKKVKELGGGEEGAEWSVKETMAKRRPSGDNIVASMARAAKNGDPKQVQKLLKFRDQLIRNPKIKDTNLLTGTFN